MNKHLVIPIFIPHLGCPHTCVFCNQKKIAGSYEKPGDKKVNKIVEEYLKTIKNKKNIFIELAFYGGSFTGVEKNLQEELLKEAERLKRAGLINSIRLSTRPDYINEEVLERLTRYGVTTVELGVQSLDKEVLLKSERGHSDCEVIRAVDLLKKEGIKVGIQLMPGLPGDTREKSLDTTRKVIQMGPDFVRIYPTIVIKETKLSQLYEKGKYKPWTLEEAVEVSSEMFILFSKANIPIIRIGLQATDNLCEGKDLIAGPYHPAFGELVKARVMRKQIEFIILEKENIKEFKDLEIYCHPSDTSQVIGQKQVNLIYFKKRYKLNIFVKPIKSIGRGNLGWSNKGKKYCSFFSRREFLSEYRIN